MLEKAFKSSLQTLYYNNAHTETPAKDFHTFLFNLEKKITHTIAQQFIEHGSLKFNLVLESTYFRTTLDDSNVEQEVFQNVAFKTPNYSIFNIGDLPSIICGAVNTLLEEEAKFKGNSSRWSLLIIDGLLICISKLTPLRGSSYIELPAKIAAFKAVINPRNSDQQFFKWAILANHVQGANPQQINERYHQLVEKYNFNKISFPTSINQINRFEKDNPGVSVNVYGLDEKNIIFPRRVSKEMSDNHFDLLLLCESEDDDADISSHYCYIKNFERLIRSQLTKHHGNIIICRRCFIHYSTMRNGE
ncbi:uncharacterized protein LOC120356177 [Nilaparvata lugens]|uniref:uncharacterized protein LOC120356177 n=1 Tax=Nilaparvata lugens TaxID=108931 RepID=UPI00193CC954|nr:uncharacterized protein LOC120356177 [Nilaparvata lugens]